MKTRFILLLLIFLLHTNINVNSQNRFSLAEAQEFALENSYALKGSDADIRKSEQKIREILAIGLPQVNAQGSFQNNLVLPTTVLPANAFNPMADPDELIGIKFGTDFNVTGSLTVSQLIFDGSYLVGLEATKGLKTLYELMLAKTEQDVLKEVTKAYHSVLVAGENERTLKLSLEKITKIYNETKVIFENGLIESQDVDQLKITVSNLNNAVDRAGRMKTVSLEMLKFHMGMKPDQTLELTDSLIIENNDSPTLNSDLKKNSDLKLLETQIMLNELDMKNQRMGYYPSLSAFFMQQYQAFRNDFNFFGNHPWYPATMWGIQLNIPVFSSGMRKAKIEQSRINLEKSNFQKEQLEHSLHVRLIALTSEYETATATLKSEIESLALADDIQQKSLVKYKEGVISSLELAQSQNQYLTAQANYINAIYTLLNAETEINHLLNNFTTK